MLPSADFQRTRIEKPGPLHHGVDGFMFSGVGRFRRRSALLKDLLAEGERIHELADEKLKLSSRELTAELRTLRGRFRRRAKDVEDLVPEAMACLVAAAQHSLGLRPFPVQLTGGLALHRGYLVEMATGEGKSLTACLPAVLAAWTGRPCHIITVNDYLATRDALEMKAFYGFCGVSVGSVTGEMEPAARKANHDKGVVYTTSKELVADFLRDRLILGRLSDGRRRAIRRALAAGHPVVDGVVMRGLDTAIVDEADSVLVDEAVTPLIISRPQENRPFSEICREADGLTDTLEKETHFNVDETYREVRLTRKGERRIETLCDALPGFWKGPSRREELIKQALTARHLYLPSKQYVVSEGKVVIVDEFTGRLMPNRTWRQGLHQAIEAKEGLEITDPSETLARLSFQRFFRMFRKLSGMTGTGREAAGEFWQIYSLPVVSLPTHRPCIRKVWPQRFFPDAASRWQAVVEEIGVVHRAGRPVLVGTRSVRASEHLSMLLKEANLDHSLLNAVHHHEEAQIIRSAGEMGRITLSTNMAGRGTDIKLDTKVAEAGGLHVIATERHESGRIDRQLFGRSARQGDPGSARSFVSLDDELLRRFTPDFLRLQSAAAVERGTPGAEPFALKLTDRAQSSAQRLAFRQRRSVLKTDTWLDEALSFTGKDLGY